MSTVFNNQINVRTFILKTEQLQKDVEDRKMMSSWSNSTAVNKQRTCLESHAQRIGCIVH